MSHDPKQSPPSSLSSIPKPISSTPVSPQLTSISKLKSTSNIDSSSNTTNAIEYRLNAFEVAQQKQANDINRLTSMFEHFLSTQRATTIDSHSSTDTNTSEQTYDLSTNASLGAKPKPNATKKFVNSETLSHRDEVKDKTITASKALFDLSTDKHAAIEQYSSKASIVNQSFNLNESTIDMNETKLSDMVSTNSNNFSFIQQLMPTAAVVGQPTLSELLQSGIKVASTTHDKNKIKDVHKLIELLTEQAKAIIKSSTNAEHDSTNCAASDFLIYTLQLMKLLFEYGLHATLEYHFALLKRVHAGECTLKGDHPMLMFEVLSKYKRLHYEKLLYSSSIHSNTTSTNSNKQSSARRTATKFTGTPCSYHTKLLGRSANHSDEQCRVSKQQSK